MARKRTIVDQAAAPSAVTVIAVVGDTPRVQWLNTFGIMCMPADEQQAERARLMEALGAEGFMHHVKEMETKSILTDISIDLRSTARLHAAGNERTLLRDSIEVGHRGTIAGFMFGYIWCASTRPEMQREASLAKARRMVEQAAKRGRLRGIKHLGDSMVRQNLWPHFRSVSHMWAALQVIDDWRLADRLSEDQSVLDQFFLIAEFFRIWGETYCPGGRPSILDPGCTWRLDEAAAERLKRIGTFSLGCRDCEQWDLRIRKTD
jgi:hypothetical protein